MQKPEVTQQLELPILSAMAAVRTTYLTDLWQQSENSLTSLQNYTFCAVETSYFVQ